jgi:hypothetical protein
MDHLHADERGDNRNARELNPGKHISTDSAFVGMVVHVQSEVCMGNMSRLQIMWNPALQE